MLVTLSGLMRDEMLTNKLMLPIHRAIKQGRIADVIRLIGDDKEVLWLWTPFGTWLQDAASHGHRDIVQWFVSNGLSVNSFSDSRPTPPLGQAASEGHIEVVRYLLGSGATIDVSDSVRNPLLSAIVGGLSESHTAVAKLLIDAGIDTSIRYPNLDNMNALEYAKEWGREDIAKLLEDKQKK